MLFRWPLRPGLLSFLPKGWFLRPPTCFFPPIYIYMEANSGDFLGFVNGNPVLKDKWGKIKED